MKSFTASLLAALLAVAAPTAQAGGPVVVVDDPVVEAEAPRSGFIVPLVVGLIVVCAIACADDEDPPLP